jgi:DNA end-binding protein Ku
MFGDRYQEALAELIKAKIKGEKVVTPEVAEPAPVVDLMAALKKSLETMKPPASSKPTRAREPAAPAKNEKAPATRGKQKGATRKAG